ncbi:hypothetical protein MKQ70_19925 [Chitinophaga sedimenti]|uniref:glycogen/starch synthase n=1 Tax=Chitinophaga sedimenti TaxID=2033606 RepID=UPI0020042230|nr:glycogen/starch synthase [Chitinophaga sedimenti]MCK7557150.1 hypothetical protein [Chitinophaga sedimenti]
MADIQYKPDFIFEVSWEVCNKVGGIHTVLTTKAHTLAAAWGDRFLLIGPDLPSHEGANPEFKEDASLFPAWKQYITGQGLRVRSGRWNIPGNPLVILIDFTSLYARKNEIFTDLWVKFRLDSLSGQWDYIEPALFGYAAGMVIAGFYECHINATDKVVAQFHEWLSGAGILYLEEKTPQVATVFTTHATVLGRAMASNKMAPITLSRAETAKKATELGIISKHSLEQIAAATADCFTTVSALTGEECEQLLGVTPDFITSNGFDITLAPTDDQLTVKRQQARRRLLTVAMAMFGKEITDDCLLVLKSGRYEFTNKGIDIFIRSIQQLSDSGGAAKEVIGFIFVPAAHTGPVTALKNALASGISVPDRLPPLTHNLINIPADPVLQLITSIHVNDAPGQKILFVPVYLDGKDGIFDMDYYDLLPGFDRAYSRRITSPWGYTPLESIAFGVPAITSSSSGFGKAAAARSPGDALVLVERAAGNDREAIEKLQRRSGITRRCRPMMPGRRPVGPVISADISPGTADRHLLHGLRSFYPEEYATRGHVSSKATGRGYRYAGTSCPTTGLAGG